MSHDRPGFGIGSVAVDGREVAVTEEVVASHPFCNLLHFRKEAIRDEPTILVVAPLSGHFPTLLRGTVQTLLPDHNVYITYAEPGTEPGMSALRSPCPSRRRS